MTKKHALLSLLGLALFGTVPLSTHANTTQASPAKPVTKQDGIIALVNNEIILQSELEGAVALLYASMGKTQLSPQVIQNQALDLLIVRKIQLGIIKRAGVTTNEAVINGQLLEIARSEGFDNLTTYAQHLEKQEKGSYAKIRNELIEQASISALWQHELSNRAKVSTQEIDAFLASPEGKSLHQDEYRTVHVRVPYPNSRPTSSQKQDALEVANRLKTTLTSGLPLQTLMKQAQGTYPIELQGSDSGYYFSAKNLPRELANTITKLSVGEVSEPLVTEVGVDVILLADKRVGGQMLLPEWQTSHILIKVDALQSEAIAEQRINDIYTALQRGASFEELAATYSEDAGSATQKGSLDWVSEGQMVSEFETMMKKTEKGDFSIPFKTQFGYHILKINDTRQRDVTEQYRRARAEEILLTRLAPQAQEDWIQELKSNSYIKIIGQ